MTAATSAVVRAVKLLLTYSSSPASPCFSFSLESVTARRVSTPSSTSKLPLAPEKKLKILWYFCARNILSETVGLLLGALGCSSWPDATEGQSKYDYKAQHSTAQQLQ
jgi:hypothetical protein